MTNRSALVLFEPIPRPMRFWVRNLVGSEEPDTQNYGFAGTWIMPRYVRRSPTRSRSDRQSNTRSVLAICSTKKPAYGAYSPAGLVLVGFGNLKCFMNIGYLIIEQCLIFISLFLKLKQNYCVQIRTRSLSMPSLVNTQCQADARQ